MTTVGFILLTHSNPAQSLRLVRTLNRMFGAPPIACHHDFGQCPLDKSKFPNNVRFVEPCLPTFWGCFTIVPAALAALRLLMDRTNPPDWIYLLSGSDYPSLPADDVLRHLSQTQFDAFIDHREINYATATLKNAADEHSGFSRDSYRALAYRRYCALSVPRPSLAKPFAMPPVGRTYLRHPLWRRLIPGPFSRDFRCYAGEHWFTMNARAAAVLLAETSRSRRLFQHLRRRESPEECFYHSVLANSTLRLSRDNLRYIDWGSPGAWHPRTLTPADLPAIRESGAHFVRKVADGSPLLTELDRLCGVFKPDDVQASSRLAGQLG